MIWNTEELAGKAIPVGTLVGFFGVLASLKDSVSELGWTVVLVLTIIGIAGWNLFIWRSRIKSRIDAETLVNRFSTTDRVISGGTSAVLLILLGVFYCQTRPPVESNGRYSIAVASRLSGFQEEEITSFSTPFTPSPQGGIKYVSRNDALRLETILFYGGLLSQDDLHFDIEHCRDITEDELISSNSERDWQTLQFTGRIIKQLRNDDSTQQPEIVNAQIENDAGLALWVLASIYSDDGPQISAAAKESVIGYFQKCFEEMDTDDNDDRELRSYIASLLTRNLHPTFVFTVSNTTTGPIVLSKVEAVADRITGAASGLESGPLDSLDHIVLKLKGLESETVEKRFAAPIQVISGDSITFLVTLKCEHWFAYKVGFRLHSDLGELHSYEPIVVDYFE